MPGISRSPELDLLQTFERLPMPLLRPLEVTAQLRLQRSARGGHFFGVIFQVMPCQYIHIYTYIYMGMGQYLLIPFLVGWTSICQLFWCSLGTRVLTHPHIYIYLYEKPWIWCDLASGYLLHSHGSHGSHGPLSWMVYLLTAWWFSMANC